MEPDKAKELGEHPLRLIKPSGRRFTMLRSFIGPHSDLGARAREVMRADIGQDGTDRHFRAMTRPNARAVALL